MTRTFTSIESVFVAYANRHRENKKSYRPREFIASYGINVQVMSRVWLVMQSIRDRKVARGMKPYHLLWCMYFLKQYGVSTVMATYFGCSDKTFRKWVWIVIQLLEELYEKNVSFFFEKFMIHNPTHLCFSSRFCLIAGSVMIMGAHVKCLSMGQTSGSKNHRRSRQSGTPTSSKGPASDMKSGWPYKATILYGPTGPLKQEAGPTSEFFAMEVV